VRDDEDRVPAGRHPLNLIIQHNVAERMRERGLTRRQMAQLAGRSASGLSFLATGARGFTIPGLWEFAEILGCPAWHLVRPPGACLHCHASPPPGYMCLHCGTEAAVSREEVHALWPGGQAA
jgi:transcriptional regulator with XRE-family HTH domain